MNKKEVTEHQRLKQQLEKIVKEAGERHAKKRGITVQMMEDLWKFEEAFKALGN